MAFNPFFFNDSPRPMELIYKALAELGELKPTVAELKTKVDELIADLDGAIQEEVQRVINEMYESGEFEEILTIEAQRYLSELPITATIDFKRIYRHLYEIGDSRRYLSNNQVRPSSLQGGCIVNYAGFKYLAYGIICAPTGNSWAGYENTGVIVIYNLSTNAISGQVKATMEHMNSMCYNEKDGYLYVAHALSTNSGGQTSNSSRLSRIKFSEILGLNVNVTDYRENMQMVNYDTVTVFPNQDRGVGNLSYTDELNENEIYCGGSAFIYKFNFLTQELSEPIISSDLSTEIYNLFNKDGFKWQDAVIFRGYAYFLTFNKSQILRCNLTTQKIEYIYNVLNTLDNGMYGTGEVESISIDHNGDMYLFTNARINQNAYAEMDMSQIFVQNILNNNIPLSSKVEKNEKYQNGRVTVYVDNTNTDDFNPDGTNSKPFRYVNEAVFWAESQTKFDGITITLHTDSNWFVQISTNKNIRIQNDTNYSANYIDDNGRASIGGIHCNGVGTVSLSSLRIYQSIINGRQSSYVSLLDGNFILNNLKIIASSGATAEICYNCNSCNVVLTGAKDFTVGKTREISGETIGVVWNSGNENSIFMTGTCFSANCHQFANTNEAIIG